MFSFFKKPSKVFCIGQNKTGTTSMGELLRSLGYRLAPQEPAEMMIEDWGKRDFSKIVKFCKKYDAFQDLPFSLPHTYQALDVVFPNSKFILTVRSSPDEWFDSLLRFTKKRLGLNRIPEWSDIENDTYRYKGFTAKVSKVIYGTNTNLFDRHEYIKAYTMHNDIVEHYFRFRPKEFLKVNLSSPYSLNEILDFLGHPDKSTQAALPHLNKS